jgi:molybdopterin-containing oxidoreductase family membrane subunit
LFIASGFLAGNAMCAILAVLRAKNSGNATLIKPFVQMQLSALAAVFVLTSCRLLIGVANNQNGYEIFRETLLQNVLLGLGAGLVVPFLILIYNRTLNGLLISSAIVLATQFMARLDLVVSGFRIPMFRVYEMPERLTYTPSVFEMLVVVASVSVVTVVYLAGEKTGLFEIAGKGEH